MRAEGENRGVQRSAEEEDIRGRKLEQRCCR